MFRIWISYRLVRISTSSQSRHGNLEDKPEAQLMLDSHVLLFWYYFVLIPKCVILKVSKMDSTQNRSDFSTQVVD